VVAAATLLLTVAGLLVGNLMELAALDRPAIPVVEAPVTGSWTDEDGAASVSLVGPPHAALLVVSEGKPVTVVVLDESGRGAVEGLELRPDAVVELVRLGEVAATLRVSRPSATPDVETDRPPSSSPGSAVSEPELAARRTPVVGGQPAVASGRDGAGSGRVRRNAPPVLHLVHDAGPRIAITFDGGSSSNGTAELLDLLAELDLRVTMFLTGEFIERQPGLVRRALLEGHEIGNHTFSHPRLTSYATDRTHRTLPGVDRQWFEGELLRAERAFLRATGQGMSPLWRAPYGEENSLLRGWAAELGYLHVRWSSLSGKSLDAWDWVEDEHSRLFQRPDQMVRRLLSFPRLQGGIVLMHLASDRHEPPWEALPTFVGALGKRDIEPVRVTDLLERSSVWASWLEQCREAHLQTVESLE
jgi:peptidoglycan/xylan/chitin deacetylase (PgdA/CDA1 family)